MSETDLNLASGEHPGARGGEPSIHELLNEATVWINYARGVTVTLADLVHEAEGIEGQHLALSLEAVAAMMRTGAESVARAHARYVWESR